MYFISESVIVESAGRPACCSLPLEYHLPELDQPGGGPDVPDADTVHPPAPGEFVDLNATRCSSALLLHNSPGRSSDGRSSGGGGGSLPICDSRQYPLQLANRTLVLSAAQSASPEFSWFWDLLPGHAATGSSSQAGNSRVLLLLSSLLMLLTGTQHHHHHHHHRGSSSPVS